MKNSTTLLRVSKAWLIILTTSFFVSASFAQDPEDESTIFDLSPFTVEATDTAGYMANSTLAGTRLKSSLEDVATSISVVTPEFMQDTGSTNLEELLIYTTGTEVFGVGGNFTNNDSNNDVGENLRRANAITRVRGLASADRARDYFGSPLPFDNYNVERVEINRGSNAILFGIGSPAGIINTSLKKAIMGDVSEVEFKIDQWGGRRAAADLNREIIKNELSVRVNLLVDEERYEQDLAFHDDYRYYIATTYAPKWAQSDNGILSGGSLRINYEDGKVTSRLPRVLPPLDSLTGWWDGYASYGINIPSEFSAKAVWNAAIERTNTGRFNSDPMIQTTNLHFRNPGIVFGDYTSSLPYTGLTTSAGQPVFGYQGVLSNLPIPGGGIGTGLHSKMADLEFYLQRGDEEVDWAAYDRPTITDRSVFDYRKNFVEGPNREEWGDFDEYNINLEQRFFNNHAGIELAMNKYQYDNGQQGFQAGGRQAEIMLNNTTHLMNGDTNPLYGVPMVSGEWQNWADIREGETQRATAFYTLDVREHNEGWIGKVLGTHTVTALYNTSESWNESRQGSRYYMDFADFAQANNNFTSNNGSRIGVVYAIGPSLADRSTAIGANIPGYQALAPVPLSGNYIWRGGLASSQFTEVNQQIFEEDSRYADKLIHSGNRAVTEIDSEALVLQSKVLWDSVVATVGWRKDKVKNWNAGGPPDDPNESEYGFKTLEGWDPKSVDPIVFDPYESLTCGFVGHVPDFITKGVPAIDRLSLRFSESENFQASVARVDVYREPLGPPSGETTDMGFTMQMFDGKLYISATWYETSQTNVSLSGGNWARQMVRNYSRAYETRLAGEFNQGPEWNALLAPPQYLLDFYEFNPTNGTYNAARGGMETTTNFVSEGFELEIVYNPTKNWRIILNAAQQEASRSGSGDLFRKLYFEDVQSNGQTYFENWSDPNIGGKVYTTASGSTTHNLSVNQEIVLPFTDVTLQDGGPVGELREWRINLITNYTFDKDSRLAGWGIGGALRYQDANAIGFPIIVAPDSGTRISDVKNPHMGPSDTKIDFWINYKKTLNRYKVDWFIQLNIRDLLDDGDLFPIASQPNGSISGWAIEPGREFSITSRFEF